MHGDDDLSEWTDKEFAAEAKRRGYERRNDVLDEVNAAISAVMAISNASDSARRASAARSPGVSQGKSRPAPQRASRSHRIQPPRVNSAAPDPRSQSGPFAVQLPQA